VQEAAAAAPERHVKLSLDVAEDSSFAVLDRAQVLQAEAAGNPLDRLAVQVKAIAPVTVAPADGTAKTSSPSSDAAAANSLTLFISLLLSIERMHRLRPQAHAGTGA